jgi:hypothetical protein
VGPELGFDLRTNPRKQDGQDLVAQLDERGT